MNGATELGPEVKEALQRHFGFREFLEGQEEIVRAVLAGRDVLGVMPTGAGKSLCYQLPALLRDGVTFVVSPLIALMKDQVDALAARGVAATMINSSLPAAAQRERLHGLRHGVYRVIYIAPERMRSQAFLEALQGIPVSLVAVDEAHCLSQWGHDFRPDYMRLGKLIAQVGRPQVIALTATATPEVRLDIVKTLELRDPFVCVSGFARPNLSLRVTQVGGQEDKFRRLGEAVRKHGAGIVYCATRKHVDEVTEVLRDQLETPVVAYHAGLSAEQRDRAQEAFVGRKCPVAVATNAFGMGIDRPDVRFVLHFDVPGSLEAYYQEAGRAGRDGEPAVCELLFNFADTRTQEFFIDCNNPSPETVRSVYQGVRRLAGDQGEVRLPLADLAQRIGIDHGMALSACLTLLGRAGYIGRFDIPGERMRGTRVLRPEIEASALDLDWEGMREKERRDREKLRTLVNYCYSTNCRQRDILIYFGEPQPALCESCDVCSERGGQVREGSDEERLILCKALSGLARMSQRTAGGWKGRYGRGRIIQMLLGSRSQEVLNNRLDTLSTYGILRGMGEAYLFALFEELKRAGCVEVERVGDYPLLKLTERGERVMRGEESCSLRWPERSRMPKTPAHKAKEDGEESRDAPDAELLERLKRCRAEAAARAGLPLYGVFSNRTLEELAVHRPSTVEEALEIHGIGPHKAERFVMGFLEVIRSYDEESPGG